MVLKRNRYIDYNYNGYFTENKNFQSFDKILEMTLKTHS